LDVDCTRTQHQECTAVDSFKHEKRVSMLPLCHWGMTQGI
jgi:hypothetical protein